MGTLVKQCARTFTDIALLPGRPGGWRGMHAHTPVTVTCERPRLLLDCWCSRLAGSRVVASTCGGATQGTKVAALPAAADNMYLMA